MIPFNIPPRVEKCTEYVQQAIENAKICGDGSFTKRCHAELEAMTGVPKALLTTSGTSALEMGALLMNLQPGDEVIMPSFTFSSTATSIALRGAEIVFVDVEPDTMNMDVECVRAAITPKTKAIVPVHYAGVCCDMDEMQKICDEYGLMMMEDAAQAFGSFYKGRPAGSMSDIGCFSFHETKNLSMGEGGAALLRNPELIERAEILREKGTDRSRFYRGQVDKYTWMDIGSSFLPSELNAAYLLAQLEQRDEINGWRMARWNQYHEAFAQLEAEGHLKRMTIPADRTHNAHMYYFLLHSLADRTALINHLKAEGISAVFHYIPLHSAPAGLKFGRFHGEDRYTTQQSERLLRLPMYYGLTEEDAQHVINSVFSFFHK